MKYYNFEDIIELTGCSQSKAYEIIRKLNEQYKKKYPESISIRGKVPKWYFNEAMGLNNDVKENQEHENNR